MEQLRIFEKESFEIQTRIRRGFEVEKENETHFKAIDTLRDKERSLQKELDSYKT